MNTWRQFIFQPILYFILSQTTWKHEHVDRILFCRVLITDVVMLTAALKHYNIRWTQIYTKFLCQLARESQKTEASCRNCFHNGRSKSSKNNSWSNIQKLIVKSKLFHSFCLLLYKHICRFSFFSKLLNSWKWIIFVTNSFSWGLCKFVPTRRNTGSCTFVVSAALLFLSYLLLDKHT